MDKYQQYQHDWLEVMWNIGRKETACFEDYSVLYVESLIGTNLRRRLMVWVYCYLVGRGKAPRIEDLEPDVKQKMWLTAKDICAGKIVDQKKMIEICKALYVIEYFMNEK